MKIKNSFTLQTNCKLCKSTNLIKVLGLSPVPVGDRYLPESEKSMILEEFPMDIMMCESCGHYQNSGFVDPELIYSHYLSRPATTNPVLSDAYKAYVSDLLKLTKKSDLFAFANLIPQILLERYEGVKFSDKNQAKIAKICITTSNIDVIQNKVLGLLSSKL